MSRQILTVTLSFPTGGSESFDKTYLEMVLNDIPDVQIHRLHIKKAVSPKADSLTTGVNTTFTPDEQR